VIDQLVELAEHGRVPTERQLRVELGLDRGLSPVGEPGRHWRDELVVSQIGENVAAPERERPVEFGHRIGWCAVREQPFAAVYPALEQDRVEGVRSDREAIPAVLRDDHLTRSATPPIRFEHLAKVKDVRLDCARGADRDVLAPQCVGQLADGEAGTVGEQHSSQDRPLLPST
jgi:hypothetical protein